MSKIFKIMGELNSSTMVAMVEEFVGKPVDEGYNVVVNSEGGDSEVFFAFYDITRRHRRDHLLSTLAIGEVCSGAPVIVASGSPGMRYSFQHTMFGMHEPYMSSTSDDPAVLQSELQCLQSNIDRFYSMLSSVTETSVATWRKRLKGKSMVYFDAKAALKWKLIDEVIE
ncbi:MAG: hypothetical protein DRJ03_04670 [Chloroflexi bacterium]|nr:MAG: hypothetical protein DRJ03_04670 [Chloroflexota bacterium]